MKIAVINETSAADRNADIMATLQGRNHTLYNAGMKKNGEEPQLLYIQTGLMTAILLNLGRVDFVVGGCGTGQGYLNSCMQYPGVFCGYILTALDAWLFTQINGGNCISLALNQGYGWAANINLGFIFDRIFSVERGCGYPANRKEPQQAARRALEKVSEAVHHSMAEIIKTLPDPVLKPALEYPGFLDLVDVPSIKEGELKQAFMRRLG
jgi:ribose 5-phosphate isomerase RpiB